MSARKTALVTGAKARLGRSIALGLAQQGWDVAVHFHSHAEDALAVVAEIERTGVRGLAVQADLAREADRIRLMAQVQAELGPMTVLINNASRFVRDEAGSVTEAEFTAHMAVNIMAPLLLSQAFAQQLPSGASGNIINIIDQRVWKLTPTYMSYTLSKSALWTMTQTLAQALAPTIRVNAVGPGPTLVNVHQSAGQFAQEAASVPLGAVVNPDAVTEAVLYLLRAQAVTGQMIAVDGGQHLAWQTPDAMIELG